MALTDIKENPVRYIKSLLIDLVVVIVAAAYIFYQMIGLEKTDQNPLVLIAQALMGIICGIVIKQALGEKGFTKGYSNSLWLEEEEKYNNSCNDCVPFINRVDNFYAQIEKEKKLKYRRSHLQARMLRYDDWFDINGNYIGTQEMVKKLSFWQKVTLQKCIRIKIYVLNLFSEYSIATENDTKKEMTDKMQRGKSFAKNTLSATIVAIIGIYFIPVLNSWSWASFISSSMQVSLWILFGIMQLYSNFNFVVNDKVAVLREKIQLNLRFIKDCQHGLYMNYEEHETPQKVEESQAK